MPFWDDVLNALGAGRRQQGSGPIYIPPGIGVGPGLIDQNEVSRSRDPLNPAGYAGSQVPGRSAFDKINARIKQYNDERNGTGGGGTGYDKFLSGPHMSQFNPDIVGGAIGSGLSRSITPPGNGIDDILKRLEELQNPAQYASNEQDLERQAMASASAQYDPVIAELQGEMSSAKTRANRNKAALGQMFSALSGSLQGEVPGINKQYATDKKSAQTLSNNLQAQIKQQYGDSAKQQAAMMKQLGIEAAASTVLPKQQQDENYFVNQAKVNNQNEQAALGQEQRGTANYTSEGSQIARYEGTNRQADLMAELQDLLTQYEGKIGENRNAKNQAYIAGLGQLQSSSRKDAYDQADRAAQNYMNEINLGRALRSDEYKYSQPSKNTTTAVRSPGDISARVLGLGLNNAQAQGITNVMMTMLSKDPNIASGTGILGQSLSKEALAQRIVEEGRRRHFSQPAINALMTVALEYFGRR